MPRDTGAVEQLSMLPADVPAPKPAGPTAQAAFAKWNELAAEHGWQHANDLTEGRARRLRARISDIGGLHNFIALLQRCGSSAWLCGKVAPKGDRSRFVFRLDWLLGPENFNKVRDGNYFEDSAQRAPGGVADAAGTRKAEPHLEDRAKLRNYRRGGFWPTSWGPRPEEHGCRLHPDVLRDWRDLNKVEVRAPDSRRETREERLAASIASWRKIGRDAHADALEVELATLRGESLVTLPPRPGAAGTLKAAGTRRAEPVDVYDDAIPELD